MYPNNPISPAIQQTQGPKPAKNLSHVPCKFFRQGACQAGNSCPFSHSLDVYSSPSLNPCKYFQKGNCKFGLKCALVHVTTDGRTVNTKALGQSVYSSSNPGSSQINGNNVINSSSNTIGINRSNSMMSVQQNQISPSSNSFNNNNNNNTTVNIPVNTNSNSNTSSQNHSHQNSSSFGSTNSFNLVVNTKPHQSPNNSLNSNYYSTNLSVSPINQTFNSIPRSTTIDSMTNYGISSNINNTPNNTISNWGSNNNSANNNEIFVLSSPTIISENNDLGSLTNVGSTRTLNSQEQVQTNDLINQDIIDDSLEDTNNNEEDDALKFEEEDYVPSSLMDLLSSQELKRKMAKSSESNDPEKLMIQRGPSTGSITTVNTTFTSNNIANNMANKNTNNQNVKYISNSYNGYSPNQEIKSFTQQASSTSPIWGQQYNNEANVRYTRRSFGSNTSSSGSIPQIPYSKNSPIVSNSTINAGYSITYSANMNTNSSSRFGLFNDNGNGNANNENNNSNNMGDLINGMNAMGFKR